MKNEPILQDSANHLIKTQNSLLESVRPFNERIKTLITCLFKLIEENILYKDLTGEEGLRVTEK